MKAPMPDTTTDASAPDAGPSGRLPQLLSGPTGLGTSSLRLAPVAAPGGVPVESVEAAEAPSAGVERAAASGSAPEAVGDEPSQNAAQPSSQRIEGLYCPPAVRDDRALADEVNARLVEWAEKEVEMYPGTELRDALVAFDAGRSVVLCHPDAPSIDHLMAAARLLAGENAVDDYFCEAEYGGTAERRGAALAVAQSAIDPAHNTPRYEGDWRAGLDSHPALRSMRSAMQYFQALATPAQAHRFRHDIANLYLGYNAEGDCISRHRTPAVWEYLVQRQFNNFRPCLTLTDAVGGYELPAHLFAEPAVQRAVALSSNASTICNDLYSLRKEQASERFHYSLPTVIAAEEDCSIDEAFQKAIEVHNELVHQFEEQAAELSVDPLVGRFMAGLANWMSGNHEWHAGNVGTRYATSP